MIRGGVNERLGHRFGKRGFPTERERPFQVERFILRRQTQGQSFARPGAKPVRQRRQRRRRNDFPGVRLAGIRVGNRSPVARDIRDSRGTGLPPRGLAAGRAQPADDFNRLAGEKSGGQQVLRARDIGLPARGLPVVIPDSDFAKIDPRQSAPNVLVPGYVLTVIRCLMEDAPDGNEFFRVIWRELRAHIVRRKHRRARCARLTHPAITISAPAKLRRAPGHTRPSKPQPKPIPKRGANGIGSPPSKMPPT